MISGRPSICTSGTSLASTADLNGSACICRDEKVKLLRCVQPLQQADTVLGQYTAGNGECGYLDDEGVPPNSKTPTFALCVLHIKNDRWDRVPFIIKAGKVRQKLLPLLMLASIQDARVA